MTLLTFIVEDFKVNTELKSKFILLLYRVAHASGNSKSSFVFILTKPLRVFYRLICDWLLCVEIPWRVQMGRRPILYHSFGLVMNGAVVIGDDCIFRHGVTIGNKFFRDGTSSGSPKVGNRVEFGVNAIVIGEIKVGDNAVIGAGCVVTKDIAPNSIVVGAPFRILSNRT